MSFKETIRNIRRLPLDQLSIQQLINNVKHSTRTARDPRDLPRLYRRYSQLYQDIVIDEKWSQIHNALDVTWKSHEAWAHAFLSFSTTQVKPFWNSVHFIDAFGTTEAKDRYHKHLQLQQCGNTQWLRQGGGDSPFTMVRTYAQGKSPIRDVVQKAHQLCNFVKAHRERLNSKKKPDIIAKYPTDQYAMPLSGIRQHNILKSQVRLAKSVVKEFVPIKKQYLENLINVAVSLEPLNPNFFKFMVRKRQWEDEHLLPKQRSKRTKWRMPTELNLKKIYRSYVMSQFYHDGKYVMSPMVDYYENYSRENEERRKLE